MALSEIIRFALLSSSASKFTKLREFIFSRGGVRDQYFGYMLAPSNAALPIKNNEICWVIQWPNGPEMRMSEAFTAQLGELTDGADAKSLLFQFEDTQISELTKALDAPICEFAIINLSPAAPLSNEEFNHSMHKTYTDCYRMPGFIGGNWAYAVNTNDTSGVLIESTRSRWLQEKEKRLACYYLGWESIKHHEIASATPIFNEEISKLAPWFGPGSGAWYVTFKKHV